MRVWYFIAAIAALACSVRAEGEEEEHENPEKRGRPLGSLFLNKKFSSRPRSFGKRRNFMQEFHDEGKRRGFMQSFHDEKRALADDMSWMDDDLNAGSDAGGWAWMAKNPIYGKRAGAVPPLYGKRDAEETPEKRRFRWRPPLVRDE